MDRASTDNIYLMDLAYTSDEIHAAMRSAVREFNSIPPLGVGHFHPDCLPGDTNLFLDGITAALLRMELSKRRRNDVDYQMAGASASTEATRIKHIENDIKMYADRFKEAATNLKITLNLNIYFGPIV